MDRKGSGDDGQTMAMSGDKNPWGGRIGAAGEQDTADPAPPIVGETSSGSPWLPPAKDEAARRSAGLDDILRQRRGGGKGGGDPLRSLPGRAVQGAWWRWALAGSLCAWLVTTTVHVVGQGEKGVVTTMGRFSHLADPGVTLTLPWPVQAIALRTAGKVEQMAVPEGAGENLLVTRDGQLIDLTFQMRWKVSDLRQFEYQVSDPEAALRSLAAAQMRAAVAELPFNPLWDGSRQGELQARVLARTQAVVDSWRMGVRLEGIDITRANPPARLGPAFSRITEAREEARKAQERAQEWAASALEGARAEADAYDAVYAQYKISPEVTRQRMYYETMERVLANNPKIIAEGGAVNLNLPDGGKTPTPPAAAPAPPAAPAGGKTE
ncbi:MAG TPA: protease modulator HflK [Novosphingobium sp.]|jgi:membrane protease subunit HflK|nr:protease modulator HflK [Novosphingobium sp.]